MKLFFIIIMVVCASLLLLISIVMLARKGKAFKYKENITEEEKEQSRKTTFNMSIFVFIQAIAIFALSAGLFWGKWYLYLVGLVLSIPIMVWAVLTLNKRKNAIQK